MSPSPDGSSARSESLIVWALNGPRAAGLFPAPVILVNNRARGRQVAGRADNFVLLALVRSAARSYLLRYTVAHLISRVLPSRFRRRRADHAERNQNRHDQNRPGRVADRAPSRRVLLPTPRLVLRLAVAPSPTSVPEPGGRVPAAESARPPVARWQRRGWTGRDSSSWPVPSSCRNRATGQQLVFRRPRRHASLRI